MTAAHGEFLGTAVRQGHGGGLATGPLVAGGSTTQFHAGRFADLGDAVLAVTRIFDVDTAAALGIELRAFAATAPGRGALVQLPGDAFVDAPGAIALASLRLASSGDAADERRAATLLRCVVTDAAPTASAARAVADWLRVTWEIELAFGSWPAVRGSLEAFNVSGGDPAAWARPWLEASDHLVEGAGDDARFLKVLSAAWLEPGVTASDMADAATSAR
ncbi:MAG: hypothetical protein JWM86_666 [Thermoleophilia bacterium]|nr:hypothetical protein [Thermoleophilia bacterium]